MKKNWSQPLIALNVDRKRVSDRQIHAEQRLELAELIQTGWIGISSFETSAKTGAKPEEQDRLNGDLQVMRQTWQNELDIRKLNVESRADAKAG